MVIFHSLGINSDTVWKQALQPNLPTPANNVPAPPVPPACAWSISQLLCRCMTVPLSDYYLDLTIVGDLCWTRY